MTRKANSRPPARSDDDSRWMSSSRSRSPFLPHVVSHCRTCARLCAALAEDPQGADESSEAIGDCAITCGALLQLLVSGSSMDRRRALLTCAADCRFAAEACRGLGGHALARQCADACMACAALCERECEEAQLP